MNAECCPMSTGSYLKDRRIDTELSESTLESDDTVFQDVDASVLVEDAVHRLQRDSFREVVRDLRALMVSGLVHLISRTSQPAQPARCVMMPSIADVTESCHFLGLSAKYFSVVATL